MEPEARGGENSRVYGDRVYNTGGKEEVCINLVEAGVDNIKMDLVFQVAAVHKPLLSVKRIAEQGNRVVFGAGGGG